jgi:hypothetical protein
MFGEATVRTALTPLIAVTCVAAMTVASSRPVLAQVRSNAQAEQSRTLNDRVFGRGLPITGEYTAGEQTFVLDQSGGRPLLRFERSNEIWALRPTPAPRGDVIYRNDAGDMVLRATRDGALTLYSDAYPGGVPASRTGAGRSVALPQISPLQLVTFLVRQSQIASQAAGRLVTFDAQEISPGSEQMVAEAAAVTVEALVRMGRDPSLRPRARQIRQILIVEGDRPGASLSNGILRVTIRPEAEAAGRPSSARIVSTVASR